MTDYLKPGTLVVHLRDGDTGTIRESATDELPFYTVHWDGEDENPWSHAADEIIAFKPGDRVVATHLDHTAGLVLHVAGRLVTVKVDGHLLAVEFTASQLRHEEG